MASFFGDKAGRTFGHTLAVDEYGFIYIHGTSTSPVFGGVANTVQSWIHVKTHWEMTYELQFDATLNVGYYTEPAPGFMGKRF